MKPRRLPAVAMLAFAILALTGVASRAAQIVTQAPCVGEFDWCKVFQAGQAIPIIRSFGYRARTRGTAQVTFHGNMNCFGLGPRNDRSISLTSQIVTTAAAVPNKNGPGGLQHDIVLKDSAANTITSADSINLATTRVIPIAAAGTVFFYFKMTAALSAGVRCYVYNAAFSLVFVP